jgi:hypothetical protein
VERVLTDVGGDVLSNSLEDLGSRKKEAIDLTLLRAIELLERSLANGVRFSSGSRLVATNVMTREEETVDGQDLSRLDVEDVTDDDVVHGHETLGTIADDFDVAFLLLGAARGKSLGQRGIAKSAKKARWLTSASGTDAPSANR